MTKPQLRDTVLSTLSEHNADKELTDAIAKLLQEYTATKTTRKEKFITIDDNQYQWCVRHQKYEPLQNFKSEKERDCMIAYKRWTDLGKIVKEKEKAFLEATKGDDIDLIHQARKELADAKTARAARYNIEDDYQEYSKDYPDYSIQYLEEA